jgi:hypothetical protein
LPYIESVDKTFYCVVMCIISVAEALWSIDVNVCDLNRNLNTVCNLFPYFFDFRAFFPETILTNSPEGYAKMKDKPFSVLFAHRFLNCRTKSRTNSLDINSHPFIRVIICFIIRVCLAMKKKGSRLLLIVVSKDANIDTCWCMWSCSYCVNLKSDQSRGHCYFWRKSLLKNFSHTWAFLIISYITGYHSTYPEFLTLCGSLNILSWVAIFYTQFSTLFPNFLTQFFSDFTENWILPHTFLSTKFHVLNLIIPTPRQQNRLIIPNTHLSHLGSILP